MYYAVISDIHSNFEALSTALAEIKKRKPDQIITPGDIVGYGANPKECLALVTENCNHVVMGNHDEAMYSEKLRDWFNGEARVVIDWTTEILSENEKSQIRSWNRFWIDEENDITLVHSSPKEAQDYHYIFNPQDADPNFDSFQTKICFFGHTHVPCYFSSSGDAQYLPAGKHRLIRDERFLINPGSVGQPRDRNPMTSFAMFDTEKYEVEIVRLPYDNLSAAEKIRKAGLPAFFADRLL